MRFRLFVAALAAAFVLDAGVVLAQGNSGCSGTVQNPVEGAVACNAYGLCKAYFAGSPTGQQNKRKAGPFVALVEAACGDCDCDENGTSECVATYCPDTNPGGKGKNPSDGSPGQSKRQDR